MADENLKKKMRTSGMDATVSTLALTDLGDAMSLAVDPSDGCTLFV